MVTEQIGRGRGSGDERGEEGAGRWRNERARPWGREGRRSGVSVGGGEEEEEGRKRKPWRTVKVNTVAKRVAF